VWSKYGGFPRDRPKVEGTDHPSASGEPLLVATYVLVNHVNESKIFCCAFELAVVHLTKWLACVHTGRKHRLDDGPYGHSVDDPGGL
jgi:hypothetical protein